MSVAPFAPRHAHPPFTMTAVEGRPLPAAPELRELLAGEQAILVEVRAPAGFASPAHAHAHESLVYVVAGLVRASFGDAARDLGPGDAVRHPAGAEHGLEALRDSVWIEVKSPPERTWPEPEVRGA